MSKVCRFHQDFDETEKHCRRLGFFNRILYAAILLRTVLMLSLHRRENNDETAVQIPREVQRHEQNRKEKMIAKYLPRFKLISRHIRWSPRTVSRLS